MPEPAACPKQITVLHELPLTPVGKIYKPALRLIATERAVAEALTRAGLGPTAFTMATSESQVEIRLSQSGGEEQVRGALLGMPIRYEISVAV
jgi:fatty-acyl-CoA synthase